MKVCKNCKSEIDSKAKHCPKCGKRQGIPKWVWIIIVIIVIAILASSSSDNNASEKSTNNANKTKSVEKFTYEILNQYNDTFAYYIEGSVKNNKDRDYSYVQIEFICYDADGNNLGTAIDNTNNLLGQQTWKYKAMFMGSGSEEVDHCDYHEITSW